MARMDGCDDVIRDPIQICYLLIARPLYASTYDWTSVAFLIHNLDSECAMEPIFSLTLRTCR